MDNRRGFLFSEVKRLKKNSFYQNNAVNNHYSHNPPKNIGMVKTPSFPSPSMSLKSLTGSDRVKPITKRMIMLLGRFFMFCSGETKINPENKIISEAMAETKVDTKGKRLRRNGQEEYKKAIA